jgi:hypothetical protein
MKKLLFLIAFCFTGIVYADHPSARGRMRSPVNVRFELPGGVVKETNLDATRCYDIFKQKPLDKDVWVDSYKIDWWVFAALQDLGLSFKTKTTGKTGGPWETTILQIGDYASGQKGKWVYYVNGIRSRYHISTQTDEDLKNIRFVYEETK